MKILIATGGTGGHIFPALQVALKLKSRGHQILFIGALEFAASKIHEQGYAAYQLNVRGFNNRSPKGLFIFLILMLKAFFQSIKKIHAFSPAIVVGFGSYSSFPVVVAAWFLGVRTIIHEQNVIPGKANKLLSRLAKTVCISFKDSQKYFKKSKIVWTGCPCHSHIPQLTRGEILNKYQLSSNRLTLFILGGSQGSQFLNEAFFESIALLQKNLNVQVVHATGKADCEFYQKRYQALNIPYLVKDFISPIEDIYSIADLVIGRAGAATISELAFFAIPSILIPYPYAEGHQMANARVLQEVGAAKIMEQKDLSPQILSDTIVDQLRSGLGREMIRQRVGNIIPIDPTENLSKAIEEQACV